MSSGAILLSDPASLASRVHSGLIGFHVQNDDMKLSRTPNARRNLNHFTKISPPVQGAGGWQLKPASGRVAGAVALGIMAAGWNAIVWAGMIGCLSDQHGPDWMFIAFLSVFALVGMVLAVFFVFTLMKALYTPQPMISLSSETVDPQRTTQVRWSFSGSKPLLDLRITLVLREETQYRRGTDTMTDVHVIREIVLFERPEPARDGTLSLTIPPDLPPSFATASNQLVWCLCLRGSVPRLPDVDDVFPLTVRPAAAHQATIELTELPDDTVLPEGTPALSLAGDATPGEAVAGVVNVPGKSVALRLRWTTSGKGDQQSEVACERIVSGGVSAFVLLMPSMPPAWSGTVLSITWALQAIVDGDLLTEVVLSHPKPLLPAADADS